jgi:hypothetical protein
MDSHAAVIGPDDTLVLEPADAPDGFVAFTIRPRRSCSSRAAVSIRRIARPLPAPCGVRRGTMRAVATRPPRRRRSRPRAAQIPAAFSSSSGDPPRPVDRPRRHPASGPRVEVHPLGYARVLPAEGVAWPGSTTLRALNLSSHPSQIANEVRRETLAREEQARRDRESAMSDWRRCSIGGEIVHVTDLESGGKRGHHTYCKRHGAERRRENRLRRQVAA